LNHLVLAYHILTDYYNDPDTNLKLLINRRLAKEEHIDAANTSRTVYGVVRKEKLLEHVIGMFSHITMRKMDLPTQILLKTGIFLMLYSEGFPDYAVVNEIVAVAPHRSKRFVNGVLRNLGRQKDKTRATVAAITDPVLRHSIHPALVSRLRELTGENLGETLEYLDSEPVFHLKPNRAKLDFDGLRDLLRQREIPAVECPEFESFEIKHPGKVKDLVTGYAAYFQNTASQGVAMLAARSAEISVLDCCAAPGSKTLTMKQLNPGLAILAADINHARLRMVKPIIRESRYEDVYLLTMDAAQPAVKNRFDLVLLDAPCSSVGTIRKSPDLKLKIDDQAVLRNAARQRRILEAVIGRYSGRLILYSVCSFTEPETDGVLDTIAGHHPIEPLEIDAFLKGLRFNFRRGKRGYYLLPTPELNNDLFYISLFKA